LRNGVWFTMIAYPIMARYAPELDFAKMVGWVRGRWMGQQTSDNQDVAEDAPNLSRLNILFAFVAIVLLVLQTPWLRPSVYKTSLLDPQTPVGAANFINDHKISGNIFHPQHFGDYLIWRLWPQQKTFIDGRVHLFGLEFVKKYQ